MPLVMFDGPEAVAIRKHNPSATWGDRETGNRCEPIAAPTCDAPFKLQRGETIFTVGSCFARNIDAELLRRGFKAPIRQVFDQPEFADTAFDLLNNDSTPSIHNEFAWAFSAKTSRMLQQAHRSAAECRLVMMTPGLVEAWFDTTGLIKHWRKPTAIRQCRP
jgi:hypothetical protein